MLNFRDWKSPNQSILEKGGVYLLSLVLLLAILFSSINPAYSQSRRKVVSKKKKSFTLTAKSALVLDLDKEMVLYDKNCEEVRSIASLTKLMTAMVFLESGVDLFDTMSITRDDARASAKSRLRPGETFYLIDLFHASLMSSDNRATRALVRATGMREGEFIERMNQKADSLGLDNTKFADPTGLNADNVSTAWETAKLLKMALSDSLISRITTTKVYKFYSVNKRRRFHQLNNSNRLLREDLDILGGKTGFIRRSGWCLAVMLNNVKEKLCVVVLGASSNKRRFAEAKYILKTAIQNLSSEELGSIQKIENSKEIPSSLGGEG